MSSPGEYYKEKMSSWLESNKLPPTNWELKDKHRTIYSEAISRSQDSLHTVKDEINKEFNEVKTRHRLMREESLVESAIGKKNYVGNRS